MVRELGIEDLDRLAATVAELRSSLDSAAQRPPRGHALEAFDPVGADPAGRSSSSMT